MAWNESRALPSTQPELNQLCAFTGLGPELSGWLSTVVQHCLKRVRRWQAPANWARADWLKEMAAHGHVAALEAMWQYDPSRGLSPGCFAMSRITARLLTRYRQEWAFASRWLELPEPDGGRERSMSSFPVGPRTGGREYEELNSAVAQLPEPDRWILQQMFWEGLAQDEIARGLGVSQPAICKRKRVILDKLRRFLRIHKNSSEQVIKQGLSCNSVNEDPSEGAWILRPLSGVENLTRPSSRCNKRQRT